jgi:bifunctional aspartokinase / homoserine dehydrogenase 1
MDTSPIEHLLPYIFKKNHMIVLKFGGSSVGSPSNIILVKRILEEKKEPFIVVVSAFKGVTNILTELCESALKQSVEDGIKELKQQHFECAKTLIELKNQSQILLFIQQKITELEHLLVSVTVLGELSPKTKAKILSFGEILSSQIILAYLKQEGINLEYLDTKELIIGSGDHLNMLVDFNVTNQNIAETIQKQQSYIAPGFVCSNQNKEVALLGRGGSDYTASILASALQVNELELWSDVDGMLNANPSLVSNARSIEKLSYKEAFELSHFGAKVLYPPAIRPLIDKEISLFLKNTFNPDFHGTYIGNQVADTSEEPLKGVSSIDDIQILTISGVGLAGIKGMASRIFDTLAKSEINIILITQSCSEQSICIGINQRDGSYAKEQLHQAFKQEMKHNLINPIELSEELAIVALVGDQMKLKTGVSGKAFSVLGRNGINIRAIAQGASERNISIVVDKRDEIKTVNCLHEAFFDDQAIKVHLFVAGIGNVGNEFFHILKEQIQLIEEKLNVQLVLVGIASSQKHLINETGIDLKSLDLLDYTNWSKNNSISAFAEKIIDLNLRNSIFIDNTASEEVSRIYSQLMSQSISIVACNKIAPCSEYDNYKKLIRLAKTNNCVFNYETCVGAALPVLKTIKDMVLSGDNITKIEAVLSGSLNFIFNLYDGSNSFLETVIKAKEAGFTEPNPLIDLSGLDVGRKLVILARESGYGINLNDVEINSFLPQKTLQAKNVDELFDSLKEEEPYFKKLFNQAKAKHCKLKVVARFENGKAKVSLEEVSLESPFYNLEAKDNSVSIYSKRYPVNPLIIKGAGAGAEVTAGGVFSDVINIINRNL